MRRLVLFVVSSQVTEMGNLMGKVVMDWQQHWEWKCKLWLSSVLLLKKAYMSESYALRPNRDQARKMRLLDGRSAGKLDCDHATLARDQYFAN